MPYFALTIMFYHVKIACYQHTRGHMCAHTVVQLAFRGYLIRKISSIFDPSI